MRTFFAIVLIFLSPLQISTLLADALAHSIDKIAANELERHGGVGITIGVSVGGETIFLKSYGKADLENGLPARNNGVYRIGSITKSFTAAAILLLQEEGKLSLEDPLHRFLPDYPEQAKAVTIRNLLQHTSGIYNFTSRPGHSAERHLRLSQKDLLKTFQNRPLDFEPGEGFQYSNSGYFLLGVVIEKVSGQKYEKFLEERIFAPLELENTTYDRHAKIIPNRVRGYATWDERLVNAPYVNMGLPFSAGALASTAEDLLRWVYALENGEILNSQSFSEMTTAGSLNDGTLTPYGLGWFVGELDGRSSFRHGGGIPGFITELAHFPEAKLSIVVLTNVGENRASHMTNRIAREYFRSTPPNPSNP